MPDQFQLDDPFSPQAAEERAANALAMFDQLEKKRAAGLLRPGERADAPVPLPQDEPPVDLAGKPYIPPTPPTPRPTPTPSPKPTVSAIGETPPAPETAPEWEKKTLQEMQMAIDAGTFNPTQYIAMKQIESGKSTHELFEPDEVAKLRTAYAYLRRKDKSVVEVAKAGTEEAARSVLPLARGALADLPTTGFKIGRVFSPLGIGQEVYRTITGRGPSPAQEAMGPAGQYIAATETGFQGTSELMLRKPLRRIVDLAKATIKDPRGGLGAAAREGRGIIRAVPTLEAVWQAMPQKEKFEQAIAEAGGEGFGVPEGEELTKQFFDDIAGATQVARAARGEGEFGRLVTPGEETLREAVEAEGGELDEAAVERMSGILNPMFALPTIAKFPPVQKALTKVKIPTMQRPKPARIPLTRVKITPKTRRKALEATAAGIERGGRLLERLGTRGSRFGPTAGLVLGATGNFGPAVLSFVLPWVAKKVGKKLRTAAAAAPAEKVATGPGIGTRLSRTVRQGVLQPTATGAIQAGVNPLTVGLVMLADDEQEAAGILGGAMAFGALHGAGAGAGRTIGQSAGGKLQKFRVANQKMVEEPFDAGYGDFAERTQANMARMQPADQTAVNILRNSLREGNIAEPVIETGVPPRLGREVITDRIVDPETGIVTYTTSTGRTVGLRTAQEVATKAGQPLRDTRTQIEISVMTPEELAQFRNQPGTSGMGANANGPRGLVQLRTRPDGTTKMDMVLNSDAFAAFHEAGHVFEFTMHPAQREFLVRGIEQAYGKDAFEQFRRYYADLLSGGRPDAWRPLAVAEVATDVTRPHLTSRTGERYTVNDGTGKTRTVDMTEAIDIADANGQLPFPKSAAASEFFAEHMTHVLKTHSLQGLPQKTSNTMAGLLGEVLETTGLYRPGVQTTPGMFRPQEAPSPVAASRGPGAQVSPLGVEASFVQAQRAWNALRQGMGPQAPEAPGILGRVFPGEAAVVAPPGLEFINFGREGLAPQRVAGAPREITDVEVPRPTRAEPTPGAPEVPTAPPRPGVINMQPDRTSVDTTRITPQEVETILQGLRDMGLPDVEIAKLRPALESRGQVVELVYASASPEGLPPAELSRPRRAEQQATYEREAGAVNAELRAIAPETREKFTKTFLPNRVVVRPARAPDGTITIQANILGLSPVKVLQNAIILKRTIDSINAKLPAGEQIQVPYQPTVQAGRPAAERLAGYDYEALIDGLTRYTENLSHGYAGDGTKITVPEGFIETVPPADPAYQPHTLPVNEASFLNALMGVEPPVTTRGTVRRGVITPEGVQAVPVGERPARGLETVEIQPTHVSARQLSEATVPGRGVPSLTRAAGVTGPRATPPKPWEVSVPTTKVRKGRPATVVKKGVFRDPVSEQTFDITEFNTFRNEVTSKARRTVDKKFDLHDRLSEAFEELNVELLENVRPASPELRGFRYPSQTLIEAGFMPGERPLVERARERLREVRPELSPVVQERVDRLLHGAGREVEQFATFEGMRRAAGLKKPKTEVGRAFEDSGKYVWKHQVVAPEGQPNMGYLELRTAPTAEKPGGSEVGYVRYTVDFPEYGSPFSEPTANVSFIHVSPEFRGTKAMVGEVKAVEALYRELGAELRDAGVGRIVGAPISPKSHAVRAKVFPDTVAVQDAFLDMPGKISKLELESMKRDLALKVQEAGGLEQFRESEGGIYDLVSVIDKSTQFMPKELVRDLEFTREAAVRYPDGETFGGPAHVMALLKAMDAGKPFSEPRLEYGFLTNKGRFVGRDEAFDLSVKAGQVAEDAMGERGIFTSEALAESRRFMPMEQQKLSLRHWSNIEDLKKTDPKKFGTGIVGEERARARDYPELWIPRTYFGMSGYKKEPGLGPYEYRALVKRGDLYDFRRDRNDLYPTSEELENAGYAPMDRSAATSMYEQRISQDYRGFYNDEVKVAALFEEQPVTPAKKGAERGIGVDLIMSMKEPIREWEVSKAGRFMTSPRGWIQREKHAFDWIPPERWSARIMETPDNILVQNHGKLTAAQKKAVNEIVEETGKPVMLDDISKPGAVLRPKEALMPAERGPDVTLGGRVTLGGDVVPAEKTAGRFRFGGKVTLEGNVIPFEKSASGRKQLGRFAKEETIAEALQEPGWAIITATQEVKGAGTDPVNLRANEQLRNYLEDNNLNFETVSGKYKGVEQGENFLVTDITPERALEIGKKFEQESVLTPEGLLYQDGTVNPTRPGELVVGKEAAKRDFVSQIEGGPEFSVGIDFSKRVPRGEIEARAEAKAPAEVLMPEQLKLRSDDKGLEAEETGFANYWLSPDGLFYRAPDHREWAKARVTLTKPPEQYERSQLRRGMVHSGVYERALQELGWARVSVEREAAGNNWLVSRGDYGRLTDAQGEALQRAKANNPSIDEVAGTATWFGKESAFMPEEVRRYTPADNQLIADGIAKSISERWPEAVVPRKGRKYDPKKIVPAELKKAPEIKRLAEEEQVRYYADRLREFYESVADQPEVQAGQRWYSDFVPQLRKAFGEDTDVAAELLAATSPNTNPTVNFGYAAEAFHMWKAGAFDQKLKTYTEILKEAESGELLKEYKAKLESGETKRVKVRGAARKEVRTPEAVAWAIVDRDAVPRQSNGKLFGMHTVPVLNVLTRQWLDKTGPKTRQFVQNLQGVDHGATIDVWAMRTLRRLGYEGQQERWRIMPQNDPGPRPVDFRIGQKAFELAAEELGMKPDALQGALWFAEKQLYHDRGYGRLDLGDFRKEIGRTEGIKETVKARRAQQELSL